MQFTTVLVAATAVANAGLIHAQFQQPINFAYFKVTDCAVDDAEHTESHLSTENGACANLDWARSIAYVADFNHTYCDTKFFADDACTAEYEIAAPTPWSNVMVDNYYTGCWDDVNGLNGGQLVQDGLVPLVNITITCS